MTSFGEQIEASRRAHEAVRALEAEVRSKIAESFFEWDQGTYDAQSIRWRLERIVRDAYRAAAAVAVVHTSAQAGIPGWRPIGVFNTDYLQALLEDVRRNLRDFKASDRGDEAKVRAISRIGHSAGVAATRGFTDAILETNEELQDFGYILRKLWLAKLVDNEPCEFCVALHGMEVGLHESFPSQSDRLKVYGDLLGPPRHPRCKCRLVILHVRLENLFERLDVDSPNDLEETDSLTTSEIQAMPAGVFSIFTRGLRKVIRWMRGE